MMRRGPAPAMGNYDSSRGRYNYNSGALRGTRQLYAPYGYHQAGPSPLVPATILGVILLITAMPYMRTAETTMAYHRQTAVRYSSWGPSSFPLPLLWIPVLAVIALQFFGSSDWYHGVYVGDRGVYGARPGAGYQGGVYGGAPMAPGRAYAMSRPGGGWGGGWWPRSGPSWNHPYRRYNTHQQKGLLSTIMDYGGHWFLILLGIALFTLVSSSSLPSSGTSVRVRAVPLAPHRLGFPWSLFSRLFC